VGNVEQKTSDVNCSSYMSQAAGWPCTFNTWCCLPEIMLVQQQFLAQRMWLIAAVLNTTAINLGASSGGLKISYIKCE